MGILPLLFRVIWSFRLETLKPHQLDLGLCRVSMLCTEPGGTTATNVQGLGFRVIHPPPYVTTV